MGNNDSVTIEDVHIPGFPHGNRADKRFSEPGHVHGGEYYPGSPIAQEYGVRDNEQGLTRTLADKQIGYKGVAP